MNEQTCIVVGASHAGVSLALQLRKEGWAGAIKLISAENELPYHRPPLSKEHLAGDKELDAMRLRPEKIYADNNIELLLGSTVLQVDGEAKTLSLDDGQQLHWDKLALCTGARVRTIPLGGSLDHIFYIRTAADIAMLKPQVEPGKRAVIIGAGYIGLEAAAVLSKLGLSVTVIEMAERVLQRVTSETMSEYMTALHLAHGVEIKTATHVNEIQGDGKVERVICADGTVYEADLVIVGIGVVPNVSLAESAGLDLDDGIAIDEFTRTSNPDIYSAGDCARYPSLLYGRKLRLESVQNANDQGRIAAANICGKKIPYDAVPWFWSDQYDVKLQMVGVSEGFDQLVCRGDSSGLDENGFALFYFKNGEMIAADCVARPKEFMVSKQLVKNKSKIDASALMDESLEPASFLTQDSLT